MEEDSVEQMFEMQNLDLLEEPRKLKKKKKVHWRTTNRHERTT
ncbi:unnamed protein product [Tenebrio molitor]|nr:unnamed protein product [Tenebrio molitor]